MNLADALARTREHYIDDDDSTQRWDDEALTRWMDVARARVWAHYCAGGGGSVFEEIHTATTDANGLVPLPNRRRVRRVSMTGSQGPCDIQRHNRMQARSLLSAEDVSILCTAEPGTPVADTDSVWPDADDLAVSQPGLTVQLEELLLSTCAEYALVKDHEPYESLKNFNREAWKNVKEDQDLDSSGSASHLSVSFMDGYGWDVDTENGGIVVFRL